MHLHGGRAVVAAVLLALARLDGVRPAEPGEFTRRAFENGRLDLAQAEALGDLLAAETEIQRRHAIAQFDGALIRLIMHWQAELVGLSAQVEALLDFSDEGDVESQDVSLLAAQARSCGAVIRAHLADPPAERLRDGVRVVIAGAPNTGKSTLLNALAGRDAAIVTALAGTTRDLIEVPVILGGLPLILIDTAGLRDNPADPVEAIGIERARAAAARADLVIALDDGVPVALPSIRVSAQCDVLPPTTGTLAVSAVTDVGMAALRAEIVARARALLPASDRIAFNARHRAAIEDAVDALGCDGTTMHDPLILSEQLRRARLALDRVAGGGDTEAVLDAVFGRFCIGK